MGEIPGQSPDLKQPEKTLTTGQMEMVAKAIAANREVPEVVREVYDAEIKRRADEKVIKEEETPVAIATEPVTVAERSEVRAEPPGVVATAAAILDVPQENPEVLAAPVVELKPVTEPQTPNGNWEQRLASTLETIKGYDPDDQGEALRLLKKDMVNGLAPAGLVNQVRDLLNKPELTVRPIDISEAQRQHEMVLTNPDARGRQQAAMRWKNRFGGRTETQIMEEEVDAILKLEPEVVSEVEMGEGAQREKIETDMRMAMIGELMEVNVNMNVKATYEQFVRTQASRYGMGKNHFPKDFEVELKKEFYARAELAAVMAFWNEIAGTKSKEVDTFKDMTAGKIDRCPTLSFSTYEWLSEEKSGVMYRKIDGVERVEGPQELREQMNKVSANIYGRMMTDLDLWTTRGEDRIKEINEMANELGVSVDSVRLTWQLAEAECWAARRNIGYVSHSAGRIMIPAEHRDFWTRHASPIGGQRLWLEYLNEHANEFPEGMGAPFSALGYKKEPNQEGIYEKEGRRFGRVGFEAWVIRVTDEKEKGTDRIIDNRFEAGLRKGVIYLFSEKGGVPIDLVNVLRTGVRVFDVKTEDGRILNIVPDRNEVLLGIREQLKESIEKGKIRSAEDLEPYLVGGERALVAGKYFTCMEAMVKQPGYSDIDLPQTLVMGDLVKGAAVVNAMDALGKVDASSPSTKELGDLRSALRSDLFSFQSNDLVDRGRGTLRNVIVKGREQQWEISNGTTERMTKATARVGEMMEEWTRSYVWLLSWQNPAHKSEKSVVGMASWVRLARDVALSYDRGKKWGDFLGYGYGNLDDNELAVNPDGTPRKRPTAEMTIAAEQYTKWFHKLFFKVIKQLREKDIKFTTTKERVDKEYRTDGERGEYGLGFWSKKWW